MSPENQANPICEPLAPCDGLDGTVLLRRAVYGPTLVQDTRPLSFGEFFLQGGAIRPYVELTYQTRWVPKGLCLGPASSIMSLAPSELVTAGVRTTRRNSFSQLVSDAAESSSVNTHTVHHLTETQPTAGSGGSGGSSGGDAFGLVKDIAGAAVDLAPIIVGLLGSIFEDIGSVAGGIIGTVVGGPLGGLIGSAAGNAIGGLIDGAVGGGGGGGGSAGPALVNNQHVIDEITNSIEHRESQSHVRQVVVSSSVEQEEFVTRTFSNPYRDRSLQLRFMPVYRVYEVITTITFGEYGLAMMAGNLDLSLQQARTPVVAKFMAISQAPAVEATVAATRLTSTATLTRSALSWSQANHDDDDLRRPMAELLVRNASPEERKNGTLIEHGLRWSAAQVRGNALHVPAAEPGMLAKAWRLNEADTKTLTSRIGRLAPSKLVSLAPKIQVRQIHLFAGTHVEAAPGECVLPDIITDSLSVEEKEE